MTVVQPVPRYRGDDVFRHPEDGLLTIQYEPPRPEQRTRGGQIIRPARPACVVVLGPLGGRRPFTVDDLDQEIRRLTDARDTLAALHEQEPLATTDGQGVLVP